MLFAEMSWPDALALIAMIIVGGIVSIYFIKNT